MKVKSLNGLLVFCVIFLMTLDCNSQNQAKIENGLYFLSENENSVQIEKFKSFDDNEFAMVEEKPFLSENEFKVSCNPDTLFYGDNFLLIEIEFLLSGQEKWNLLYDSESNLKPENKKRIGLVIDNQFIARGRIFPQNIGLFFTLCHCDYSETELKEIEEIIKIYNR